MQRGFSLNTGAWNYLRFNTSEHQWNSGDYKTLRLKPFYGIAQMIQEKVIS